MVSSPRLPSSVLAAALRLLLVVCVFVGATEWTAAAAAGSSSELCGAACPCEHASATNSEQVGTSSAVVLVAPAAAEVAASTTDEGDCADGCLSCNCCLTMAATAVFASCLTSRTSPSSRADLVFSGRDSGAGECTDVFRPPRRLG